MEPPNRPHGPISRISNAPPRSVTPVTVTAMSTNTTTTVTSQTAGNTIVSTTTSLTTSLSTITNKSGKVFCGEKQYSNL